MERDFLQGLGLSDDVVDAVLGQHEGELAAVRFDGVLSREIVSARGKNQKAIAALLDVESLRGTDDPEAGVKEALAALQKSDAYLFESAPAPYAAGAGRARVAAPKSDPMLEAIRSAAGLAAE